MSFNDIIIRISLGIITGYCFGKIWHLITIQKLSLEGHQHFFNYHFHHSLFAVIPILLIPIFFRKRNVLPVLIGIAIGILIEHRISFAGWYFITKIK
jgi:hypothetical protein